MKTIKYEIEATSTGYIEKVFIDGELFSEIEMGTPDEYYEGCLEQKSGKSFDDAVEDSEREDMQELYNSIPSSFGMDLVSHLATWDDE